MKFTVKIDHQKFEVEVNDLRQRPLIVLVDGEPFEVWPEDDTLTAPAPQPVSQNRPRPALAGGQARQAKAADGSGPKAEAAAPLNGATSAPGATPAPGAILTTVRAPIPGVITAVNVSVGASVSQGETLCVLEAMKMNNSIRSSRQGTISAVHVAVGQHVKHHDVLIEFAE